MLAPILVYSKLWWFFVLPKPSFINYYVRFFTFRAFRCPVPSCYECYPVYLSLLFYLSLFLLLLYALVCTQAGGSKGRSWRTKPHPCARHPCFVFRMWKKCTNFKIYQMNWIIVPINVTITTNKQTTLLRETILVCFVLVCGVCRVRAKGIGRKRKGTKKTIVWSKTV